MKLKNCPFCGQPAKVYETTKPGDMGDVYYTTCGSCHIGTDRCYSEFEAITLWNRRICTEGEQGDI